MLRPLGAQTIVPGHGPVFHDSGPIEATLDYLRFVLDVAAQAQAAGVPPLDAARDTRLGRFAGGRRRADRRQPAPGLRRARLRPARCAIDIVAALGDMVSYNGGVPLSCLA